MRLCCSEPQLRVSPTGIPAPQELTWQLSPPRVQSLLCWHLLWYRKYPHEGQTPGPSLLSSAPHSCTGIPTDPPPPGLLEATFSAIQRRRLQIIFTPCAPRDADTAGHHARREGMLNFPTKLILLLIFNLFLNKLNFSRCTGRIPGQIHLLSAAGSCSFSR